jgi:hypothetical protein
MLPLLQKQVRIQFLRRILDFVKPIYIMSAWKLSSHFEYLENWSGGLDVTWQPGKGDLTAHV